MGENIASIFSNRHYWSCKDVADKVSSSKVVIFTKGDKDCPCCGYSQQMLEEVQNFGHPYEIVNVKKDSSIFPALRAYAGDQTLPCIFIDGYLVCNSQTQKQAMQDGSLKKSLQNAFAIHS